MTSNTGTRWYSTTRYIDIDTGEILTKHQALKTHYLIIKTDKYVTFNKNKTEGYIQWIKQCKKNTQQELFAR